MFIKSSGLSLKVYKSEKKNLPIFKINILLMKQDVKGG